MRRLVWRIGLGGSAAAVAVWLGGLAVERVRFGASDDAAMARVEAELRQRFLASADTLGMMASMVAAERPAIQAAPRDSAAARHLFEVVAATLPADEGGRTGLTIYGAAMEPLAWAGSVSDIPRERVAGPATLFVAPGALGPRLVRIEPLLASTEARAARYGTVVVEQLLERLAGPAGLADTSFVVSTSLIPVTLRIRSDPSAAAPATFVIPSRGGGPLVSAVVTPADLEAARLRLRAQTRAAVLAVLALTLLFCAAPLLDKRRTARTRLAFVAWTATLVILLAIVRTVAWLAASPLAGQRPPTAPLDLLLTALLLAALVWMAFDTMARCRVARPRPRLWQASRVAVARVTLAFLLAAACGAGLLAAYERFLQGLVAGSSLDLLEFSLHPAGTTRLLMACALVLLHAVAIWGAAACVRLAMVVARTPQRGLAAAAWGTGSLLALAALRARYPDLPMAPLAAAILVAGGCAVVAARISARGHYRSQAAGLGALFLALLVPALAMYPSLRSYSIAAKERLVATTFAPLALSHREDLQLRLRRALEEIDATAAADLVGGASGGTAGGDRAFLAWSQTELARYRLTSAVELYGPGERLLSRFALNLPEYNVSRRPASGCNWELFDEVSPFGSTERHVLDASRRVCRDGQTLGMIVVRVMLDYRTLPFISSQSPYLESLSPAHQPAMEGVPGRDIEFVIYGWSRGPLYASGTGVWPLPDATFQRTVSSRAPFWTTLARDGRDYRVYFASDRGGIFALGYPAVTWLGYLLAFAELVTLTGVLYVALLAGGTLFDTLTSRTPTSGQVLMSEVRTSFYRKLFLAFVLAAVVPVATLALATQTYFAAELRAGIEDAAARTATVAERLVEDYATLQQRGVGPIRPLDDQIMVLVGRAIDEDVNLFDRARLQATSERDLFASRLLSTRTPASVYRTIVLDRQATYVGVEHVGDFSYLLAAAPVRAGDRQGIVTVPVTLRQQQIEREIDELNRRVLLAAILFVLFGAALGYWMAERIADPVSRLTRVTRQITRGNLDASTAATSADELGRLIGDFNKMARELKRQRAELERTQRLEAWADMARQVAHDIKNPLTPIQLSAEHARRINADRGNPLSPVLDNCVNAILSQVRLLRQIATEFSSFASSPTPRLEPVDVAQLLEELVAPYRAGLGDRVAIEVSVPDDLPTVLLDRTLAGRALTNVIENAVHAMPAGGRLDVTVSTATRDAARVLLVRLADTGVGLDPEALARIFEPYFSTKATGTGLGLTIARRNVELVGGTILVTSTRGIGTTVTISLPFAPA